MSQYYFLTASLPTLNPESDQVPDPLWFNGVCKEWLSPSDMTIYDAVDFSTLSTQTGHSVPLIETYRGWVLGLKNAVGRLRASKLGLDASAMIQRDQTGSDNTHLNPIADVVRGLGGAENPLEAENHLFKAQWKILEELEVGHYFDFEKILLYRLKIELLLQKSKRTRDRGQEHFEAQYSAVAKTFPLDLQEQSE